MEQLFEGIWKRTTWGTFLWSLVKMQSIVSEEKFFEGRVYGRTHGRTDGWLTQRHDNSLLAFGHWSLKSIRKTLWKKVKLLKMSNFTFCHNVFYAISILKSFNSHISVVVCSFFEFGMVSKCCIGERARLRYDHTVFVIWIHELFSIAFFFFQRFCEFENNTTSNWLDYMIYPFPKQ